MEVLKKLKIKKFIPALTIFILLLFITSYHTSSLIQDNTNTKTGNQKTTSEVSTLSEDIQADENAIVFDLAKGNVKFTDDVYVGYDTKGNIVSGSHDESNIYVIEQSDNTNATSNTISVGTSSKSVLKKYTIYLSGINILVTNNYDIPIYVNSDKTGEVYLILKDKTTNIVELNCTSKANIHAAIEKELDTNGLLVITCEHGYEIYKNDKLSGHDCYEEMDCGSLLAYGNRAKLGKSNPVYYSGAGIGTRGNVDGGKVNLDNSIILTKFLDNLTIAGGKITAMGAVGGEVATDVFSGGGAGIGTGCSVNPIQNETAAGIKNFNIVGGYINAYAGDDSAAGIGGGYRSNKIEINIYGGTIESTNRVKSSNHIRGAGIGAGGGGTNSGSPSIAAVKIYGGNVRASSQFGAAIGGAGGGDGQSSTYNPNSLPAYVYIYGGNINAISTGIGAGIGTGGPYGTASKGSAGKAFVEISGGTVVASSELGADIGGGGVISESKISNGGAATISITGGKVNAMKNGIGGGKASAGNGGAASINISGGNIQSTNIGGGFSKTYGYASSDVTITGGSINSSISSQPTNGINNVYLTRLSLYSMDLAKKNQNISSFGGINLLNNYGLNDVKTDDKGTVYLWLPSGGVINKASDGENEYEGSVATKSVGILQYNSSKKYFSTKISYNKDVKLYTDEKLTSEFSGSLMVPSNTDTSFYVQAEKYPDGTKNSDDEDNYKYYDINLYMSDGNTMKKLSPSNVDSENGVYKYTVNITSDNYIWIESSKGDEDKKLSIDLSFGNAVLESGSKDSTNKLKVNGYSLDNYDGDFYLTSAGLGVTNNLIVKSGTSNITTNSLVLSTNNNGIEIENGEVNLYSSASNDSITSTDNSAIYLKKGSSLNIYDTTNGSLGLTTKKDLVPAIDGEGNVVINKKDGFLIINSGEGATSIRADDYTYNAENKISNFSLPYTITLANREFVGFVSSYSGTNKIYDSTYNHTTTSNSSFKAIGVEYIKYGDEVITHSIVNDNLVFNVENIDESKKLTTHVKNGNSLLENNTNYVWQQTNTSGVLKITGSSITDHLITAFIEEEELAIVVDAVDQTYNYDGSEHSIDVRVVFPTVGVKLEYCTDTNCFLDDGSKNTSANWTTTKPTISTVGVHSISWNASSPGYKDKGGVNTLTINKADNYFTSGGVMIESISKGDTLNPRATSKYGTPYFEYSSTYTGGYTTTPPTDAGIYYVRAVVDETNEYKGIVSDAVSFFIEDPTIYTLEGNYWDKINMLGAQKSTIAEYSDSRNYETSILMNFNYVPDTKNGNYIAFVFAYDLPVGTYLSLVDFSDDDYHVYYYKVEKETNTVYSNQFMQIGTTTKKSFEVGESGKVKNVLYQLNVKSKNGLGGTANFESTLRIVKNVDGKDLTLITPITLKYYLDSNQPSIVANYGNNTTASRSFKFTININNLNSTPNYTNVLALSLNNIKFSPNTKVKVNGKDAYINGNLATSDNIINGSNEVILENGPIGSYKYLNVRVYNLINNQYNVMFPTKNSRMYYVDGTLFSISKAPEYALKVSTNSLKDRGIYVGDSSKNVKFNLKYKAEEDNPKFNLVVKKNGNVVNNWTYKLNDSIINTSSLENSVSTSSLNLTIPKNTEPGTYKLYFTLGDKTVKYSVIVLDSELSDVEVSNK